MFVQATIARVLVKDDCVEIQLNRSGLTEVLYPSPENSLPNDAIPADALEQPPTIILTANARLMRCGLEVRLAIPSEAPQQESTRASQSLIKAVARGRNWYEQLTSRGNMSLGELAQASQVNDRYASRILRFAFLAPDIIEAILEGRQPKGMTLEKAFLDMPLSWEKQRQLFGL
jgi:site-specific DNA recombinase